MCACVCMCVVVVVGGAHVRITATVQDKIAPVKRWLGQALNFLREERTEERWQQGI